MNKFLSLEYPYYKYILLFDKKNILKNVKAYKPDIYNIIPNELKKQNIEKFDNNYFIMKEDYIKTELINNITNYFSEQVRVKCNFINNISPLEYWNKNKKNIIKKTIEKYKKLSVYYIREIIFFETKLCSNFRITVALTILNYFKPKTWLDISAGWGDRLMSAILYNIKLYVATDPNLDLHPCYDKMIETFVTPSKRKNFIIFKNGFLEAQLPNKKFDIVFTSPPFFTTEIYSVYPENSVSQYKNEKAWCNNFFIKSLIKAYNYLKKDGHMILYMGGSSYVMDNMHKLDKVMKYRGVIYFWEKKPRAIYVWQKTRNDKIVSLDII